jgi:hypothetical protein
MAKEHWARPPFKDAYSDVADNARNRLADMRS